MALTINSNISVLRSIHHLHQTQSSLGESLQRISSGLRVTRAADDPAGLAIATRMNSDIQSLRQSMRNTNDGISMIQTAEGGLNELNNILIRMRELSVQASNETYNSTDRSMIATEMTHLQAEYSRIVTTSNFNRTDLLNSSDTSFGIQVGIHNTTDDRISINLNSLAAAASDVGLNTLFQTASIAQSGQVTQARINIDLIDDALDGISTRRARLGALQNRLESALNYSSNSLENLTASQSRILDVDYASESANLARYQIQQQASVAALAQAKSMQQSIISLLS